MRFATLSPTSAHRVAYREVVSHPGREDATSLRMGSGAVRPGARLAVDVGSVRIGVAGSDPRGILASPVATVRRGRGDVAQVARLAADRAAVEVLVGLPVGLSGRPGASAAAARAFAVALARAIAPASVRLVDERFTTVLAEAALRAGGRGSRQRRAVVDQAAAATLLQEALDAERLTGNPVGELVSSDAGGE